MNETKKYPQRKYYLHWRIRKAEIKLDTKQKTILIPFDRIEEQKINKYVVALIKEYNYVIQLTIN